jgi:GNAT superfamily N-acetyltransferase
MSTIIRLADAADLLDLTSLIQRYWEFEHIEGFKAARIATLLIDLFHAADRGQIWVARQGDRSVGYLLAVYLFSLGHGGLMAEIDKLFVIPEKRAHKIGGALLDAATAAISQHGITHLQLGIHNTHGKRFYGQHGFEALSEYTLLYRSLQLE